MIEEIVTVKNKGGIHARPAGMIVKLAQQYQSDIYFIHNGNKIEGKRILTLLAAMIEHGEELDIICQGADEIEAAKAFKVLFSKRFGEE